MTFNIDNTYIGGYFTLLGKNENLSDIKSDLVLDDYYLNEKCVELCESKYQIESINGLLNKYNLNIKDIDLLIGGDLQNQLLASNFASRRFDIPFIGVYSACSTYTLALIIASLVLNKTKNKNIIVTTSSHNLVSEKQFRFPIEYGSLKKCVSTFTSTGSVSTLISNKGSIKVKCATIGSVVDIGYSVVDNIGACMVPSVAKTIYEHLKNTNTLVSDYDLILTGDLGIYGVKILKEYLYKEYDIKLNNVMDAGSILFDNKKYIAGGSGPLCLPMILFTKIINSKYKRVLLVGSGSLHSKLSVNVGESVPSISHAVYIEVIK